uniref:Uncharacterized protein n=1 Tax=Sciurus vulgaris TaxID=55149 RepID=A0A8D2DF15_SCIVU
MARSKQAWIPGCGSGGLFRSDLLGAGIPGAVFILDQSQGTFTGSPRTRASGKTKQPTHLSAGPAP